MCEECGKQIVLTVDGVCVACNKTLCYDCWCKGHKPKKPDYEKHLCQEVEAK